MAGRLGDGRRCRLPHGPDDFDREGPGIEIDLLLRAERGVPALNQIIAWRGASKAIRVDNGPECVGGTLMEWAENRSKALTRIQPGKPQRNAHVARRNRTGRHEWLDLCIFGTIDAVRQIATGRHRSCNDERADIGSGGKTPAQKPRMAA